MDVQLRILLEAHQDVSKKLAKRLKEMNPNAPGIARVFIFDGLLIDAMRKLIRKDLTFSTEEEKLALKCAKTAKKIRIFMKKACQGQSEATKISIVATYKNVERTVMKYK